MHQWTGWALDQVMACRQFGAKPYITWTNGNKFQWNLNQNFIISIQENAFENVVCQNGGEYWHMYNIVLT